MRSEVAHKHLPIDRRLQKDPKYELNSTQRIHFNGVLGKRQVSWLGVITVDSLPKQMLSGNESRLILTVAGPHRIFTGFPFKFTTIYRKSVTDNLF
jgi:hypothetical protein